MPIKSFRGLIEDNSQETIPLSTNNGMQGYKIVKLELFPKSPGYNAGEHVIKIYSIPQTSVDAIVDFSDQTLLATAYLGINYAAYYGSDLITVFDTTIFNQDIVVTHVDVLDDKPCNYHIELEQVKLDLTQNTVATLKDIRNIESNSP